MSSSLSLAVWCQTDVGLRRDHNEDSFLFDEEIGLYMVADGMGGHRGGEVASRMAVETTREYVRRQLMGQQRRVSPRQVLAQAYHEACSRIYDRSQDANLSGMGTTLVAALYHSGTLYVANVGDSRAYLFSNGRLWQITEDHSLINEQLRAGLISEEQIARTTPKNVITRSVGFERDVQVDIVERTLQPGEMILMCSDGLSGLVADRRIAEICSSHHPSEVVSICIDEAKNNGGDDNVTVMVLCAGLHSN